MPRFTQDNLQRILINPFYALTVAPELTAEHDPPMSEAEWIQANASLIREVGAERWLQRLLDVLEEKAVHPDEPMNPFHAVNIDPLFAAEHPPLIERDMWVNVNAMQVHTMGPAGWLRQLLDVLGGDIVTAEEVGLAPPGGLFAYGTSGSSNAQRRGKRDTTSKRSCFQIGCSFPGFLAQEGKAVLWERSVHRRTGEWWWSRSMAKPLSARAYRRVKKQG